MPGSPGGFPQGRNLATAIGLAIGRLIIIFTFLGGARLAQILAAMNLLLSFSVSFTVIAAS